MKSSCISGILGACAIALLLHLCVVTMPGAERGLKVGDPFPALAGFGLEGGLPALTAGKIVVVDFWASWCSPCRQTFPLMEELHHRFGKRGLIILAINADKSRAAMTEFLKEYPVTFPVVRDAKKKLAAAVNVPVLPTSYVLDGQGKVRSILSGEKIALNRKLLVKEVERLLDEKEQKAP